MFSKLKMAIGSAVLISSAAHAGWFAEAVDLKKFPQVVVESEQFTASPELKLKEVKYSDKLITFEVLNASVVEERSSYIKFANTGGTSGEDEKLKSAKRTSKKTNEETLSPVGEEPYRKSISTLGGLFPIAVAQIEVNDRSFKVKPVSKAVKEIKGIDGALFPLKVGNALFFSYSLINESEKFGITFEVTNKLTAQVFGQDHPEIKDLNLIGDIYVISQEIKSTNESSHKGSCEHYYADEISYIIGSTCPDREQWVKSIKLNKAGTLYRSEVEETNLTKEQEEIENKKLVSQQLTPETKAKAKEKFTQAFNLFKEGEFEAAVIRFNQALEIDPANGLGHYYLAETYARLNDVPNSKIHYNYTVLFSPDIKEAAVAEVKLSKIKEAQNKSAN